MIGYAERPRRVEGLLTLNRVHPVAELSLIAEFVVSHSDRLRAHYF